VDLLRERQKLTISLVAEIDDQVCGHIAFSEVSLLPGLPIYGLGLGLGPVAVRPENQRQGIGSALIIQGIKDAEKKGYEFIVVLGDPAYYHRFGFQTAIKFGLENEYGVEHEFMVLEIPPGALTGVSGLVRYAEEFAEVGC
jgi:putative acetyltransferase